MFDPLSRSLKNVTLRIEADSLFLLADSAAFDSTTNQWVKAHQDSVRGWRVTHRGSPLTAWVDKAGRLIAASEPGGITMVRTAFEIAFVNWNLGEKQRTLPLRDTATAAGKPPGR
jgi:zona occludens toxin (predicted ATPase)